MRAVPSDDLAAVGEVAARDDRPLHVHLSEQPGENLACEGFYGCSPTELLAARGCSTPRTTVVHATHLSDNDIELLGARRTTACFCPTTERDLADGIGPARRLHDAGVALALGSDQHAVIDPFEEIRGVEMHERLESLERGRFGGADLLAMGSLERLPRARLGRRRADRGRAPRRPRRRAARQPAHRRLRPRAGALRRDRRRRHRRRRRTASGWSATAGTGAATSAGMLTDAIAAVRR